MRWPVSGLIHVKDVSWVSMFANRKARRRAKVFPGHSGKWVRRKGFRPALLGTAAASVLFMGLSNTAHAQAVPLGTSDPAACDPNGGPTVTCTGNLSGGVDVDGPAVEVLNVNNLDAPGITPAAGTDGINFTSNAAQDITINADTTGTAGIAVTGDNANGIEAAQNGGDGAINVTSSGNISTSGSYADGILAQQTGGNGNVMVTSTGDLTVGGTSAEGINVSIVNDGNATIMSTGEIDASAGNNGLFADVNGNGSINIVSVGDIQSGGNGIFADADGTGDVFFTSTGNITSDNNGFIAFADDGNVVQTSTGNITSDNNGLIAFTENGNVTQTSTGDITADNNGFFARAANGNIVVNSTGTIMSDDNGIDAEIDTGDGNISITSNGDIETTEADAEGIQARQAGGNGYVTVISTGDISTIGADSEAIFAQQNAGAGDVTVTSTGNINTQGDDAEGIFAQQNGGNGNVSVTSVGSITTQGNNDAEAIFAQQNGGDGNVSITSSGNINVAGDDFAGLRAQVNGGGTGNVNITSTGNVTTQGNESEGISAQVNGGGDGNVTVTSTGDISTQGDESVGIFGQQNGGGNGFVSLTSQGNITTIGTDAHGIFGQQNNGDGDVTTTSSGDISTQGDNADGIQVRQDGGDGDVTVISTSNISTLGDNAEGIVAVQNGNDGNVTVTSNGDISTQQSGAQGIFAQQSNGIGNVTVTNSGAINSFAEGLLLRTIVQGDVIVTNTGDITTQTQEGFDIAARGDGSIEVNNSGDIISRDEGIDLQTSGIGDITVVNDGDITTNNGNGISAIRGGDGIVNIANSGTIALTAVRDGIEVNADGDGVIIVANSGTIDAGAAAISVEERTGVAGNLAPATITNSGALTGGNGFAIDLQGDGNDVVNLEGGSVLDGAIDFGNGNDPLLGPQNLNDVDTLNVGAGVNAVISFEDTSGTDSNVESAPENINTANGGLLLIDEVNDTAALVAVDATGFAAQQTFIGDITTSIFNLIDANRPAAGNASGAHGRTGDHRFEDDGNGRRLWGSVFGGFHDIGSTSNLAGFEHSFGGLLTGIETGSADVDGTIGLFGGYARSNISVDSGAGGNHIDTFFGGGYWKRDYGSHRINLAFAGGTTDNENTRNVGGLAANADFRGWFVAPSLTVAAPADILPVPAYVSARVNYVGLFLDGYTETGPAPGLLTIGDRDVNLFQVRGQLTLPQTILQDDGNHTHVEWRIGVDAQFDAGSDNVDAAIAGVPGTPFSFSADTDDEISGFSGVDITHTSADGMMSLILSGELQSDFDNGYEAVGKLTATVSF